MEDMSRYRLRTVLGELMDHMEGAEEVASGIAQRHPEYGAMAEAVRNATESFHGVRTGRLRRAPEGRLTKDCVTEAVPYYTLRAAYRPAPRWGSGGG